MNLNASPEPMYPCSLPIYPIPNQTFDITNNGDSIHHTASTNSRIHTYKLKFAEFQNKLENVRDTLKEIIIPKCITREKALQIVVNKKCNTLRQSEDYVFCGPAVIYEASFTDSIDIDTLLKTKYNGPKWTDGPDMEKIKKHAKEWLRQYEYLFYDSLFDMHFPEIEKHYETVCANIKIDDINSEYYSKIVHHHKMDCLYEIFAKKDLSFYRTKPDKRIITTKTIKKGDKLAARCKGMDRELDIKDLLSKKKNGNGRKKFVECVDVAETVIKKLKELTQKSKEEELKEKLKNDKRGSRDRSRSRSRSRSRDRNRNRQPLTHSNQRGGGRGMFNDNHMNQHTMNNGNYRGRGNNRGNYRGGGGRGRGNYNNTHSVGRGRGNYRGGGRGLGNGGFNRDNTHPNVFYTGANTLLNQPPTIYEPNQTITNTNNTLSSQLYQNYNEFNESKTQSITLDEIGPYTYPTTNRRTYSYPIINTSTNNANIPMSRHLVVNNLSQNSFLLPNATYDYSNNGNSRMNGWDYN